MVISLQQCLTQSYLIKRNSKRFNTKWSWHRTQYPTRAQEDMVHLVSSYLTFQTYSLWLSSGSLTSCMLSKNWDFLPWTTFPQRDIARNRSVPALRLGPGLHTLSPLVFLQHSEGFFSPGAQFIPSQTQLQILHPKAPLQDLSQGLAVSYLPNVHKSAQNSAWASSSKATPDINIL